MRLRVWTTVVAAACFAEMVRAEEPPAATRAERRFIVLTERVPHYALQPSNSNEPFRLVPAPVLKWTNPVRDTETAAVFLWTDKGRAAAVMCSFWRNDREYKHEFQSLSDAPFQMILADDAVWTPRAAGATALASLSTGEVAKSRPLRLAQMRRLTREFKAYLGSEDGDETELRLLPQPLYRYAEQVDVAGVVDGAVFAFVQGTDPEILLVLEAVTSEDGSAAWHASIARMSRWPQSLRHRGKTVWSCQWVPGRKEDTYCVLSYTADETD